MCSIDETKLKNFLNIYWLRPENALLQTFRSIAFDDIRFESPSIDISAGDGVFIFTHLKGELDRSFDYYQSTKAGEFRHDSPADIYDICTDQYNPKIRKKPEVMVDYGTDWKKPLLDKAAKLGIYKNQLVWDNNKLPMPFADGYFKTVYSNSIYWVKDVGKLISEIYRITNQEGIVLLNVVTPGLLETLDRISPYLSSEAVAILDRGRKETMVGVRSYEEWKKLMIRSGFKIKQVRCVYPDKLLVDLWNIGLRPISHLLIKMSNGLSDEERIKIKEEWVNIFFELFRPLLSVKETYSLETCPSLLFILKK